VKRKITREFHIATELKGTFFGCWQVNILQTYIVNFNKIVSHQHDIFYRWNIVEIWDFGLMLANGGFLGFFHHQHLHWKFVTLAGLGSKPLKLNKNLALRPFELDLE
jgi:hypothetical protein